MGILGLTGFIDRNTHFLHPCNLKDTAVIIDGNNFYHYLYKAYHIESLFGGDFDIYREKILLNLKCMMKCNVKPFFVFDGAYTRDDRKLKTSMERARNQIKKASAALVYGRGHVTPLLSHETFVQTLDELQISHVTCQFEADNEIVKLANRMKCPVISNDSDFYIFDLIEGFLPLDYIDFNPLNKINDDGSKSPPFLFCRKYEVKHFIQSYRGLSRSILPVFATLLGNDYVSPHSVNKVYAKVQVPKACRKVNIPKKLSKMVKLIHWLEMKAEDEDDILDRILPFVESKKRFLASVSSYYDIMNFAGCDLLSFFSDSEKNFKPTSNIDFYGYNGATFPDWFVVAVCKGEIPCAVMNAAILHRIIFRCQIEDMSLPNSYQCCEFIRRVIYGILLHSDPPKKKSVMLEEGSGDHSSELSKAKLLRKDYDRAVENIRPEDCVGNDDVATGESSGENDIPGVTGEDIEEQTASCSSDDEEDEKEFDSNCDTEEVHVSSTSHKCNEDYGAKDKGEIAPLPQNMTSISSSKQSNFEEYIRERYSMKKRYIAPVSFIKDEPLPSLSEIGILDKEKRLSILLAALRVDKTFVTAFSPDISLYALCLSVWVSNATPQITEHHLDCAILCSILIHMHNAGKQIRSTPKKKSLDKDVQEKNCIDLKSVCGVSRHCDKFKKAIDNLSRYHQARPEFSLRNPFNIELSHSFLQLQCCMYEVSNLNKLLRFPLPSLKVASFFNGTFLYNFFADLITRQSLKMFIEAMMFPCSDMHNLFLQFKSTVLSSLPQNCFRPLEQGIRKRHKKKKGKKKRKKLDSSSVGDNNNCNDTGQSSNSDQNDGNSVSRTGLEDVATLEGFDINNKYALLSLSG